MLPTVWRQVRPEGPRTRLKPMTAGDGRVGKLRRFHRTGADRSLREVGCQDLPFFTSEFRFCHGLSYFMLDFMERRRFPCSEYCDTTLSPSDRGDLHRGLLAEDPIIGSSMGGSRRGAGHVLFLAGSNPDRRAWWLLSPAPGWVEEVAV